MMDGGTGRVRDAAEEATAIIIGDFRGVTADRTAGGR